MFFPEPHFHSLPHFSGHLIEGIVKDIDLIHFCNTAAACGLTDSYK